MITPLYKWPEIEKTVYRLATEIDETFRGESIVLLGVMQGCLPFMMDLSRRLSVLHRWEFVEVSSYEGTMGPQKPPLLLKGPSRPLKDSQVLIVEDIVDTGSTLWSLLSIVEQMDPANVTTCAMLDKPANRQYPIEVDFVGITVPDKFLVGYGLDIDGKHRNLPYIGVYTP